MSRRRPFGGWAPWDVIDQECTFFCETGCGRLWDEFVSMYPDDTEGEATCTCGAVVTSGTDYAEYLDKQERDEEAFKNREMENTL
jgi:hypothetical protein